MPKSVNCIGTKPQRCLELSLLQKNADEKLFPKVGVYSLRKDILTLGTILDIDEENQGKTQITSVDSSGKNFISTLVKLVILHKI